MKELREQLERTEIELNDSKQTAIREQANLKKKVDELQKQLKSQQKQGTAPPGPTAAAAAAQISAALEDSQEQCRALEVEINQQRKLIEDLELRASRAKELEWELTVSAGALEASRATAEEVQAKLEGTTSRIEELDSMMKTAIADRELLRSRNAELEDYVNDLEKRLEALTSDLRSKDDQIGEINDEWEDRVRILTAERDDFRDKLDAVDEKGAGTGLLSSQEAQELQARHQHELNSKTAECEAVIAAVQEQEAQARADLKEHFGQMRQYVDKLEAELNAQKQPPEPPSKRSFGCCYRMCSFIFRTISFLFFVSIVFFLYAYHAGTLPICSKPVSADDVCRSAESVSEYFDVHVYG